MQAGASCAATPLTAVDALLVSAVPLQRAAFNAAGGRESPG
jgi:hypothetical protein